MALSPTMWEASKRSTATFFPSLPMSSTIVRASRPNTSLRFRMAGATTTATFEQETGCQVNVQLGNTSDEMVQLIKSGQYDAVSASGDASLRLIAAGDVEPINTA